MSLPVLIFRFLGIAMLLAAVVGFNFAVWGLRRHPEPRNIDVSLADAERGRLLVRSYGCGSCHQVPGVPNASGRVGPNLAQLRERTFVAGVLPTSGPSVAAWIRDPQTIRPGSAMPDLNVSERDARDMAAYLLSLP